MTEDDLLVVIDCRSVKDKNDLKKIAGAFADHINNNLKRFPKDTKFFLAFQKEKDSERWNGPTVFYSPLENDKKWFGFELFIFTTQQIERAIFLERMFIWKEL